MKKASTRKKKRLSGIENTSLLKVRSYPYIFAVMITALPLLITRKHWSAVIEGYRPRAWDGTGHYALAQIYSERVFPLTSGWVNNYFAGMPFPNFYPPLFYWLVAFLAKPGLVTFLAAFKIVVSLPVIIMPLLIWYLAYRASSRRDKLTAAFSALGCVCLLLDYHFTGAPPPGLDYFSTFQIGIYTQPLGFVLFLIWLVVYSKPQKNISRICLSSILLALIVLANFFSAILAGIFIASIITTQLLIYVTRRNETGKRRAFNQLMIKLAIPVISFVLSSFWLVPMFLQSKYFVTRPTVGLLSAQLSPVVMVWYMMSVAGFLLWIKKITSFRVSYFGGCLLLLLCILFAPWLPSWFPFQSNRFISMFNFLLCISVGSAFSTGIYALWKIIIEKYQIKRDYKEILVTGTTLIFVAIGFFSITPVSYNLAFFPKEPDERLKPIFDFASQNKNGQYLAEIPSQKYPIAQLDGRAINSYLGSQGNDVASVVFRESSPNSLFYNPLANKFSAYNDSYGISSILADDRDFIEQPTEISLKQANFLGVRYLIVISPWIKEKLNSEIGKVRKVYDSVAWSIYELTQTGNSSAKAVALPYKPYLVISAFSFKQRQSNDISFVRLAEEQLFDAAFDVNFVYSNDSEINDLPDPDKFSGLIIEKYDYEDEDRAYRILYEYAQKHSLILVSNNNDLFIRLERHRNELPNLYIVNRPDDTAFHILDSEQPTSTYKSSTIRQFWREMFLISQKNKVPIAANSSLVINESNNSFTLHSPLADEQVPILIRKSYHPNWQRTDGKPIYWVSPFFMLTFSEKEETNFIFGLNGFQYCVAIVSLIGWILVLIALSYDAIRRRREAYYNVKS